MKPVIYNTGLTTIAPAENQLVTVRNTPTIRIEFEIGAVTPKQAEFLNRDPYLVFSSRNGVQGFQRWLTRFEGSIDLTRGNVWAVGERTARLAEELFGVKVHIPDTQSSTGLIDEFKTLSKRPVVLVGGNIPRPEFSNWLAESHWTYCHFPVYKTTPYANPDLTAGFINNSQNAAFFSSPSTVEGFLLSLDRPDFRSIKTRLAAIGATTALAITAKDGDVFYQAPLPDFSKAFDALVQTLTNSKN